MEIYTPKYSWSLSCWTSLFSQAQNIYVNKGAKNSGEKMKNTFQFPLNRALSRKRWIIFYFWLWAKNDLPSGA